MRPPSRVFAALFVLSSLMTMAQTAGAAGQRTFVSSMGLDTNPCSVTSPCRTFSAALAQTISGGEIVVLDSAGYGPVTIAQSVSIVAPPGVYAGITVPSGANGITISAGSFDVAIRGITINSLAGAQFSISASNYGSLAIESCVMSAASGGIYINSPAGTTHRDILLKDLELNDQASIQFVNGPVNALIDRVLINRANTGLFLISSGSYVIRDTVIQHSYTVGMQTMGAGTGQNVTVENSTFSGGIVGINIEGSYGGNNSLYIVGSHIFNNEGTGLQVNGGTASGGATYVAMSRNSIIGNWTGVLNSSNSAVIESNGDNTIRGNGLGGNVSGTITTVSPQ